MSLRQNVSIYFSSQTYLFFDQIWRTLLGKEKHSQNLQTLKKFADICQNSWNDHWNLTNSKRTTYFYDFPYYAMPYHTASQKTSRQRDWETYGWKREGNMLFRQLSTKKKKHFYFSVSAFLFFFKEFSQKWHFWRPMPKTKFFFFSFLGGAAARADVLRLGNPQTTEGSFPVR